MLIVQSVTENSKARESVYTMLMLKPVKRPSAGFTIVEITVVLVVLALLAALTYSIAVPKYRERSYQTRANSELNTVGNALTLYVAKYNDYPADVNRDLPSGIQEFLQGQYQDDWPDTPYPGCVYDYDRWDSIGVIQISIRCCNIGDSATCNANANKYFKNIVSQSVLDAWDSYSSVYYCIKGNPCRSHSSKPPNHPGHCINCSGQQQFF